MAWDLPKTPGGRLETLENLRPFQRGQVNSAVSRTMRSAGMMAKAALAVREARFWRRFGQDPKPGLRQSVQASGVLPRLVRPVFEDSRPQALLKPPDDLCFGEERQIPRFAQHNRGGVLLALVARSPFGKRRDHEAYDTKGRGVGHVAGDRIDDWRLQSGMP